MVSWNQIEQRMVSVITYEQHFLSLYLDPQKKLDTRREQINLIYQHYQMAKSEYLFNHHKIFYFSKSESGFTSKSTCAQLHIIDPNPHQ